MGSKVAIVALLAAVAVTALSPRSAQAASGAAPTTPYPGGTWQPDPVQYGVDAVHDIPVQMSDGVTLIGDVFYPTDLATGQRAAGTFPVLLTQNPYSTTLFPVAGIANADYFVPRGYIAVEVDVRGTNRSGGFQTVFGERQAQDGAELVDWVAHRLDGSNGVVGLEGVSYLGINQYLTASRVGPNSPLRAIAPMYAGAETYREPVTDGGIPTSYIVRFYEALSLSAHGAMTDVNQDLQATRSGQGPSIYDDAAYQAGREPRELASAIVQNGIPAMLWSGSADLFPFGTLEMYAELQNASAQRPVYGPMSPRQQTTGRYQVVFGNYGHGADPGRLLETLELEWYDTWLKGQHTGMDQTRTPMHVFEQGDNRWVNTSTYPAVSNYTPYYLDHGGSLNPRRPSGSGRDPIVWAPTSTVGATRTYTTPPFAHGATLAGPIDVSINASSNTPNVELALELDDVAPDGAATPLTTGSLIGSLRAVDPKQSWYDQHGHLVYAYHPFTLASQRRVPQGRVQRYDISLAPRAFAIGPGHQLRLVVQTDVSGRPPGTSAGQGLAPTDLQLAQLAGGAYQIHRGPIDPSVINLPLLAAGALPSAAIQTGPLDWGS